MKRARIEPAYKLAKDECEYWLGWWSVRPYKRVLYAYSTFELIKFRTMAWLKYRDSYHRNAIRLTIRMATK